MNEILLVSLAQVSEQMGFLTPDGPGTAVPADGFTVAVGFRHPHPGLVRIAASRSFAEALARNLLALDPAVPVPPADALDALKELANIAAGNCLPQLYGDAEYHLDPPLPTAWSDGTEMACLSCAEGEAAISVGPA